MLTYTHTHTQCEECMQNTLSVRRTRGQVGCFNSNPPGCTNNLCIVAVALRGAGPPGCHPHPLNPPPPHTAVGLSDPPNVASPSSTCSGLQALQLSFHLERVATGVTLMVSVLPPPPPALSCYLLATLAADLSAPRSHSCIQQAANTGTMCPPPWAYLLFVAAL